MIRRISSTGEPVFGKAISIIPPSSEEVLTRLCLRLRLFKDEWFLNRNDGVGFFDIGISGDNPRVFGHSADQNVLESEVKKAVLETDGVVSMTSFTLEFDHETRKVSIIGSIVDIYGEALPFNVVIP